MRRLEASLDRGVLPEALINTKAAKNLGTPGAGALSGSTQNCACARLWPDRWMPHRPERLDQLPGLPPPLVEQQQAPRLAEAGAREVAQTKEVLEPRRQPALTKPRTQRTRRRHG